MVGTRFIVVKLKDVIRYGLIALAGLALVIALIIAILPKRGEPASGGQFNPGTYGVNIILNNKPVELTVRVNESEIEEIALAEMAEAHEVFYPLFRPTLEALSAEIIRTQSTDELVMDMGNMYTSRVLIDAVDAALLKAVRN